MIRPKGTAMTRRTSVLLCAAAVLCLLAASTNASPRGRYGVMGKILSYDAAKQVVLVKVMETKIPDVFNSVGKRPPKDIKSGKSYTLAVQPEGSVLIRTVVKTRKGWAADKKGTQEGFDRAIAALPDDRLLGLSLAMNPKDGEGAPTYKLMLIHVPYTQEEFMERLDSVTADEGDMPAPGGRLETGR